MVNKERKASFYSLSYKISYTYKLRDGETWPQIPQNLFENAPELMIQALKTGELYSTNSERFTIEALETTEEYILLLLNFTTDKYSDPNYIDTETHERKSVEKNDTERMEFSCHVMIKRETENGCSEMIVEKVSGFSKMRLANLINQLFRNSKSENPLDFQHDHPDGSIDTKGARRQCKFKITVDVDGVPSDKMRNDIENGRITGLELVSREKHARWDQQGYFTEKQTHVKMEFTAPPGSRMASLRSFLSDIRRDHPDLERAKIRFQPPGQTKGSESASFDLMEQDPTECDYFNKTANLNFSAEQTSYEGFIDQIVSGMKEHLRIQV